MAEIIPSILTDNPEELYKLISLAEDNVDMVQIDIVDGKFANNKTIDPVSLNNTETDLKLDYHLMVLEPANWIEKCARAQAYRIIGQIEKMSSQEDFIKRVQNVGAKIGLAVDLDTPVEMIEENLMGDLDVILIMSVKAGFGGQNFDKKALGKISKLDSLRKKNKWSYKICCDGGITNDDIRDLMQNGVDEVVIGKRLFEGDFNENIINFNKISMQK